MRTRRMRHSGSADWRLWISCGRMRDGNESAVTRTGTMRPALVIHHETQRAGFRLAEPDPIKMGTGSSRASPAIVRVRRRPCARPKLLRGPRRRSSIHDLPADRRGRGEIREERIGPRAGRSGPRDGDDARRRRGFPDMIETRTRTGSGRSQVAGNLSTINALTWIARLTYLPNCARIINRTCARTKVRAVRQNPFGIGRGCNRTMSPTRRRRPAADAGADQ